MRSHKTKNTQRNQVQRELSKNSVLRLSELCNRGISPATVSRMVEDNELVRLSRGLYQLPEGDWETYHHFPPIAKKIPEGVICLLSALSYHNLAGWLPRRVSLAVGKDTWVPKEYLPKLRIFRFSERMLTSCVDTHLIEGTKVKVFNIPKTLADCFRNLNKVGIDVALEGLETAIHEKVVNEKVITKYAKEYGGWNLMQPYLEAIISKTNFTRSYEDL